MADKPAALVLAPECPYPAVGGGPLRTASLIEYLSRKYEVDLVVCGLDELVAAGIAVEEGPAAEGTP